MTAVLVDSKSRDSVMRRVQFTCCFCTGVQMHVTVFDLRLSHLQKKVDACVLYFLFVNDACIVSLQCRA